MEVIEKIRIRDIFLGIREIFGERKSNVEEKEINEKLQQIYKAEAELGATKSIEGLEKEVQEHKIKEKTKKKTKKNNMESAKNIDIKQTTIEKDIDDEKDLEI